MKHTNRTMSGRSVGAFVALATALLCVTTTVNAFSNGIPTLCTITPELMGKKMGGQNDPSLGAKLVVTNLTATSAVVSITSDTTKAFKGVLLWSEDKAGKSVGNWTLPPGTDGVYQVNAESCNSSALTHASVLPKPVDPVEANALSGFTVTWTNDEDAKGVVVKAVVVGDRATQWQFTPHEIVSAANSTDNASTTSNRGQRDVGRWGEVAALVGAAGVLAVPLL